MNARRTVAASFAAAAATYDRHAGLQRVVARALAARIVVARTNGLRVLEIGSGTGLLTAVLAPHLGASTQWTVTDIAPAMLDAARDTTANLPGTWRFVPLDLTDRTAIAALGGPFDLICGSLVWQWLPDRRAALAELAGQLAPGGRIALSTLLDGSLAEWRDAWPSGAAPLPHWPDLATLQSEWPGAGGHWQATDIAVAHDSARAFLRDLRGIGAALGTAPPAPGPLRTAIRRLDATTGGDVSYRIGYGTWRRPPRPGLFVTGTDTGIGKTLVAAILARALGADYWKPLQTGLAEDPGDTAIVTTLAGAHTLTPAVALQAPLSPHAAARAEGLHLDLDTLGLPEGTAPIVVEGAGGLLVPADDTLMLIDLVARFGLPVVLVARSELGTINHTLLSLEALRMRGLPIAGVILNGPINPGNRDAIARHGQVKVLAEIPPIAHVDPNSIHALADQLRATLKEEIPLS